MKISVAIMAHHSRLERAEQLKNKLEEQGFEAVTLCVDQSDESNVENEWANGKKCLTSHNDSDWHIIIQDDAIISNTFRENVLNALAHAPERSLISFYTGKVRPHSASVTKAVIDAGNSGASWLSGYSLFWGVGIAIPTEQIGPMLDKSDAVRVEYDKRIGLYYQKNNMSVYYTYPSLVDHDYMLGSLVGHDHGLEPRVAHRYEPQLVEQWNDRVVRI